MRNQEPALQTSLYRPIAAPEDLWVFQREKEGDRFLIAANFHTRRKQEFDVSNFVPKPHTPYQWNGMQTRDYFEWAHRYLRKRVKLRAVKVKCHDINRSLLEGILTRGDLLAAHGRRLREAHDAARHIRVGRTRQSHRPPTP